MKDLQGSFRESTKSQISFTRFYIHRKLCKELTPWQYLEELSLKSAAASATFPPSSFLCRRANQIVSSQREGAGSFYLETRYDKKSSSLPHSKTLSTSWTYRYDVLQLYSSTEMVSFDFVNICFLLATQSVREEGRLILILVIGHWSSSYSLILELVSW